MKALDETDKPSKDARHLISEAIELLAETSDSPEPKERTMNTIPQTMDDGDTEAQDAMRTRVKRQTHEREQARMEFDTEASPTGSSKSISREQSFWFKLAGDDTGVSK